MGLEGIVSKWLGSRYRSSRSKDWLKFKNPAAPGGEARGGGGLGRETLEMTTRTHFSFRINARTAKASGRSPANAPGFLDRDEAFALQAFDHSKRRRQQLAAFAGARPLPVCHSTSLAVFPSRENRLSLASDLFPAPAENF
jgi:hypothetical protein